MPIIISISISYILPFSIKTSYICDGFVLHAKVFLHAKIIIINCIIMHFLFSTKKEQASWLALYL